jgi:molybdopterin-biosynthesis enzyme MoeA-like protein
MPTLDDMAKQAVARAKAMTPQERAEMFEAQKRSFVLAEAGFGSDEDEAAYAAALAAGDKDEIARLDRESAERVASAARYLDRFAP